MESKNRVYRVKCRNPDCSNPNPDKIFEFKPDREVFLKGPFRWHRDYEDEILIAACPWCKCVKKIHVFKDNPNDKVY